MISKFKLAILLLRCFAHVAIYGSATRPVIQPKKIVIIQLAKLGDMVCTTPVFQAIKRVYPDTKVTVVGDKINQEVLEGHPAIDSYIVWNKKELSTTFEEIKRGGFDFGCIMSPDFEGLAALLLAHIPLISAPKIEGGISPYETKTYRIIRRFIVNKPHWMGAYAPREYLRLLEPIGIETSDTQKRVFWSRQAEKEASRIISSIPSSYTYLVGMSAGAGNKEKQWDPRNFAAVADYLIKECGAHILIFGGKRDAYESAELLTSIENKQSITDATNISIDTLKAALSKLDVFLSVNTGPLYIAEALDIPTVDLVGPVSPWDQPPQGKIHKVVFPPGRPKPIIFVMDTRNHDTREAERIAQSTRVEDVITAAKQALNEVRKRSPVKKE